MTCKNSIECFQCNENFVLDEEEGDEPQCMEEGDFNPWIWITVFVALLIWILVGVYLCEVYDRRKKEKQERGTSRQTNQLPQDEEGRL